MRSKLDVPAQGICAGHRCDDCRTCQRGRCCRRDNPDYQLPGPGEWEGRVFGQFGVLDVDELRVVCHACGGEFGSLIGHIGKAHDLTAYEYRAIFALPSSAGLVNGAMSRQRRQYATEKLAHLGLQSVPLTREQVAEAQQRFAERERKAVTLLARVGQPVTERYRKPLDPCIVCGQPVPAAIRNTGRKTCSDACKIVAVERDQLRLGEARRLKTKRCSRCGKEKPVETFDRHGGAQRAYRPFCRDCGDGRRKIEAGDHPVILQRLAAGESQSAIARSLGVSASLISLIARTAKP